MRVIAISRGPSPRRRCYSRDNRAVARGREDIVSALAATSKEDTPWIA